MINQRYISLKFFRNQRVEIVCTYLSPRAGNANCRAVGHFRLGGEQRANHLAQNVMTAYPIFRGCDFDSPSPALRPRCCILCVFGVVLCLLSQSCTTEESIMASIARQSPMLRQSCLSAFRSSPLVNRNAAGVSQMVAFHASAKKQILPPLPRELALFLGEYWD